MKGPQRLQQVSCLAKLLSKSQSNSTSESYDVNSNEIRRSLVSLLLVFGEISWFGFNPRAFSLGHEVFRGFDHSYARSEPNPLHRSCMLKSRSLSGLGAPAKNSMCKAELSSVNRLMLCQLTDTCVKQLTLARPLMVLVIGRRVCCATCDGILTELPKGIYDQT